MRAIIKPSVARGSITAPPSKSYSHRAMIAAGLARGNSLVHGVLDSEDISATCDCLRLLGVDIKTKNSDLVLSGMPVDITRVFEEEKQAEEPLIVPCRESGSTIRFFVPLFLLAGRKVEFQGYGRLMERPMKIYEDICEKQGLIFKKTQTGILAKGPLRAGDFEVPGNVSSQFITGLLFALPLLKEDSSISLIPPVESRSYIRMTLEVLRDFGITVQEEGDKLIIPGGQSYQAREYTVEGDYSNAAFLEALGLVSKLNESNEKKESLVELTGLKEDSLQGDKIYRKYFSMLEKSEEPIDIQDCPDLGPILMAMAAIYGGGHFINTARLKIKESDRGVVMAEELAKFGIKVQCMENEIIVEQGQLETPKVLLQGHNDHRIAMALSVVCTLTGGEIEEAECVKKSYPGFFEDIRNLGIGVELCQ